jgi:hypothetical protein
MIAVKNIPPPLIVGILPFASTDAIKKLAFAIAPRALKNNGQNDFELVCCCLGALRLRGEDTLRFASSLAAVAWPSPFAAARLLCLKMTNS